MRTANPGCPLILQPLGVNFIPERKIAMNATSALSNIKKAQPLDPVAKLKRILAPVDFSTNSERALQYVVEPTVIPDNFGMVPPAYEQVGESLMKSASERLPRMAAEVSDNANAVKCLVRSGRPAWEIVRVAAEVKADLIIITTHGYTGLKHVLMGSTAELIVRHAPCPVMTVPMRGNAAG
jgi:universal stress protein A